MEQGKGRRYPREQLTGRDKPANREKGAKAGKRRVRILTKALMVSALLFASLIVGLMIGYGVLGKSPVWEVFDPGTYKHMYDLIFAGT